MLVTMDCYGVECIMPSDKAQQNQKTGKRYDRMASEKPKPDNFVK